MVPVYYTFYYNNNKEVLYKCKLRMCLLPSLSHVLSHVNGK